MTPPAARAWTYAERALGGVIASYPTLRLAEHLRGSEIDPRALYIGSSGFAARLGASALLGCLFALPTLLPDAAPERATLPGRQLWLALFALYFAAVAVLVP